MYHWTLDEEAENLSRRDIEEVRNNSGVEGGIQSNSPPSTAICVDSVPRPILGKRARDIAFDSPSNHVQPSPRGHRKAPFTVTQSMPILLSKFKACSPLQFQTMALDLKNPPTFTDPFIPSKRLKSLSKLGTSVKKLNFSVGLLESQEGPESR